MRGEPELRNISVSFSEFFGHEFCWFGVSGFVWVSIFRNLFLPEVIPQHFAFMVLFQPPGANHGLVGLVGTGPRICPLPALRPLMLPSGACVHSCIKSRLLLLSVLLPFPFTYPLPNFYCRDILIPFLPKRTCKSSVCAGHCRHPHPDRD